MAKIQEDHGTERTKRLMDSGEPRDRSVLSQLLSFVSSPRAKPWIEIPLNRLDRLSLEGTVYRTDIEKCDESQKKFAFSIEKAKSGRLKLASKALPNLDHLSWTLRGLSDVVLTHFG